MPDLEEHSLYDGDVTLTYDDDAHSYFVDGEELDGVTSTLSIISKGGALQWWAVNETLDYCRDHINAGTQYTGSALNRVFKEARTARFRMSEDAMQVGTRVHEWIERYLLFVLGDAPGAAEDMAEKAVGFKTRSEEGQRVQSAIKAFLAWEESHDVEYLATERVAYSREHGYAGRGDLVCRVEGALTLLDFKTSKAIYPEYYLQGAAYAKALEEEGVYGPFDQVGVLRVPKDGDSFEFGTASNLDALYQAFLSALHLTRWKDLDASYAETADEKTLAEG